MLAYLNIHNFCDLLEHMKDLILQTQDFRALQDTGQQQDMQEASQWEPSVHSGAEMEVSNQTNDSL